MFSRFAKVKDLRNQSYIDYSTKTMLGILYYKYIGRISSMQEMTWKFNDERIVKNLYSFLEDTKKYYLPHGGTLDKFLERVSYVDLKEIQKDLVYT